MNIQRELEQLADKCKREGTPEATNVAGMLLIISGALNSANTFATLVHMMRTFNTTLVLKYRNAAMGLLK